MKYIIILSAFFIALMSCQKEDVCPKMEGIYVRAIMKSAQKCPGTPAEAKFDRDTFVIKNLCSYNALLEDVEEWQAHWEEVADWHGGDWPRVVREFPAASLTKID